MKGTRKNGVCTVSCLFVCLFFFQIIYIFRSHTQILVHRWGPEQGFLCCFTSGLNQNLTLSPAQAVCDALYIVYYLTFQLQCACMPYEVNCFILKSQKHTLVALRFSCHIYVSPAISYFRLSICILSLWCQMYWPTKRSGSSRQKTVPLLDVYNPVKCTLFQCQCI